MPILIDTKRKRSPRNITIGVALSEQEVQQLDARRGELNRSEAIRAALKAVGLIGEKSDAEKG